MQRRLVPLALPTLSFVLGTLAQTTFLFFLVPAYANAHGLGRLQLFAFAAAAVSTMLVGIPAGRLADAVPRRRVMRFGWTIEGLAALWLVVAPPGVVTLLLAAAGMGTGFAFGFTAFQSYVADVITGRDITNGYGITSALAILGSAAGPFAGAALIAGLGAGADGVRAVAMMLSAAGALAAISTFVLPRMRGPESPRAAPATIGFSSAFLAAFDPRDLPEEFALRGEAAAQERRTLAAYAVVYAAVGLGYGLTAPWFGPRLIAFYQMPPAAWGVLLGWSTVLAAGAIYLAGLYGRRNAHAIGTIAITSTIVAASMVGFAFATTALLAGGLFLVRQFFGNAASPILSGGLMQEVTAEARGRTLGVMNIAWNLPWAIGAAAGGALLATIGAWTFVLGAGALMAGPLLALAINRRGGEQAQRSSKPRQALAWD